MTSDSTAFGRIDADGHVFVRTADGEHEVGQWAAGTPEEGLAFYARKYDDLMVELDLAGRRLKDGRANAEAVTAMLARMRAQLADPGVVGDLAALAARCDEVEAAVGESQQRRQAERAAARAEALARREALVAEAEGLSDSTHWKAAGDRFRTLLDEWKVLPHGDRSQEQSLWKRFSAARSAFDKRRRAHFAKLDAERGEARSTKAEIVAEAESLADSTDWGPTAGAYRDLMCRWKAAPRASRGDEDALWARFRAAQDRFFAARSAAFGERDAGLRDNLSAKEALLVEAEALLPVTDLAAAKRDLRSIQERWERVGHVPRADKDRVEGRLRRVEEAVRTAEADRWRRTDPAKKAFAESTVATFRASVEKLTTARDRAAAGGDDRALADAEQALQNARTLLEAAERGLSDFS